MVANLVRRYDRDNAYRLVRSSFAQYLSEQPLTRQLDAVIGLLTQRGYLTGWHLTADGERLSGLYHDCDLLLAEAIADGIFDGLDLPDLVAMTSLFTFEARREGASAPLPNANLARRHARLEELAAGLRADERASRLPRTRDLDTGFAALAHDWARGSDLARLLAPASSRRQGGRLEPVMSGGDFVRNIKQLVDLLRQLGATAAGEAFGKTADEAAEELVRGVVAASVGLTGTAPQQVVDDPR
jgi:ATP-dependent RNA helicase HelY